MLILTAPLSLIQCATRENGEKTFSYNPSFLNIPGECIIGSRGNGIGGVPLLTTISNF